MNDFGIIEIHLIQYQRRKCCVMKAFIRIENIAFSIFQSTKVRQAATYSFFLCVFSLNEYANCFPRTYIFIESRKNGINKQ